MSKHALAAVATLLSLAVALPASAECKLTKIGEIPVKLTDSRPLVEASINGQKAMLIVDTGAWYSMLFNGRAKRFGMDFADAGITTVGVKGDTRAGTARVSELKLGNLITNNTEFVVMGGGPASMSEDEIDGLLGREYFGADDLEFDFANGVIRLFGAQGCGKTPMAYWSQSYLMAELENLGKGAAPELTTWVQINGKRVHALFDTGAPTTVVALPTAENVGLGPERPGSVDITPLSMGDPRVYKRWVVPFDSFSLGDETINRSKMMVADLEQNVPREVATGGHVASKIVALPDMLIGLDFLRAHRVYFARSQNRIYFTYNGGPVFATRVGSATPTAPAAK